MNQSDNNNLDAPVVSRTQSPGSDNELGRRLSAVIDLFENRQKASLVAERSKDQLWKWTRGTAEPPFRALAKLCAASEVRLDWLATGEGPMMRNQPPPSAPGYASKPAPDKDSQNVREPSAPMDMGLLTTAARITDEVLRDYGVRDRVNAEGFAELVHVVYQDMAHGRAEDAASEALSRILAITRAPQD